MQLIGKAEVVTYAYTSYEEMHRHLRTMQKDGWLKESDFVGTDNAFCVVYRRDTMQSEQTIKDLLRGVTAPRVIVKSYDKELYNDTADMLVKGMRISDRLLWDKVVLSYALDNNILTIMV